MQIAFLLAPEGVEQVELTEPWQAVLDSEDVPHLVSTHSGQIQAFNHLDKADTFPMDRTVEVADVRDYGGLVLPGGVANPDALRMDKEAVAFVKCFFERIEQPVAGPGLAVGRQAEGRSWHAVARIAVYQRGQDRPVRRSTSWLNCSRSATKLSRRSGDQSATTSVRLLTTVSRSALRRSLPFWVMRNLRATPPSGSRVGSTSPSFVRAVTWRLKVDAARPKALTKSAIDMGPWTSTLLRST